MLTKLITVPRNHKKPDCRMDDASTIAAVVVSLSENVFDKREKNSPLLTVGWLKIN